MSEICYAILSYRLDRMRKQYEQQTDKCIILDKDLQIELKEKRVLECMIKETEQFIGNNYIHVGEGDCIEHDYWKDYKLSKFGLMAQESI